MMDKVKIEKYLTDVYDFSSEDIKKYQTVIDNEIKLMQHSLIDNVGEDDERALSLVAARVNYNVLLLKASENSVTKFSAGDISISESDNHLGNAKQLVDIAYKNCACLLNDDSFAFLGV